MDFDLYKDPIVREKPARGREMQVKIIPKDLVEISAGTSNAQENEPKDRRAELYYEGYIDGKPYLVPDSNLEAMKDMINLKMRRIHSSCEKPKTSLNEPTQYHEFESKLDDLLEKVDKLAKESEISVELDTSFDSASIKSVKRKTGKRKVSKESVKPKIEIKMELPSKTESEEICPPLLDKSIKYKTVRPKDPSKRQYIRDLIKFKQQIKDDESSGISSSNLATEKFRLLISGHLRDGFTPVFIVHQNYVGPNILENHKLDFNSHQKEGNIDIFVSGKFFHDNILEDESPDSPAVINIDSKHILIDKLSNIHSQKFKDIYSLGPVDISLEGEFVRDEKTFKFTPILSLEIVKIDLPGQLTYAKTSYSESVVTPVALVQSNGGKYSPFQKSKTRPSSANSKNSKWDDKTLTIEITTRNKPALKIVLDRFKTNVLFRKLFNKRQNLPDMSGSSPRNKSLALKEEAERDQVGDKPNTAVSREKSIISRIFPKWKKGKAIKKWKKDNSVSGQVQSTSAPTSEVVDFTDTEESNISKVKKHKKLKRGKKNQAIIENPILAQMQEFFLAA